MITNSHFYILFYRDSYWPGGVLAEASPERPLDAKRRLRMVTKAKMLGSIPGTVSNLKLNFFLNLVFLPF